MPLVLAVATLTPSFSTWCTYTDRLGEGYVFGRVTQMFPNYVFLALGLPIERPKCKYIKGLACSALTNSAALSMDAIEKLVKQ